MKTTCYTNDIHIDITHQTYEPQQQATLNQKHCVPSQGQRLTHMKVSIARPRMTVHNNRNKHSTNNR